MNVNVRILQTFLLFLLIQSCSGQNNNDKNVGQTSKINSIDKKSKKADTVLTLLTYGLPDMERQNSRNVIAKKWGVRFHAVAGCMVTEQLIDSVKSNNNTINEFIKKKYGTNWQERFEKEIDEEFEKEKIVSKILDKVDFVKKKNDQMHLEGNGLHYFMTPIETSANYNVSVEGWGTIDNKDVWVSYYRMTVNYKTKKYKLISNKVENTE